MSAAKSKSVSELLAGAVPMYPGGAEDLAQWAKAVEQSDTKLKPECDLAMDTTGATIPIEERVGEHADVDVGDFDDGWLVLPAMSRECPNCEGEQPGLVVSNDEREIILIDCIGCRTRYDAIDVADDGGDA